MRSTLRDEKRLPGGTQRVPAPEGQLKAGTSSRAVRSRPTPLEYRIAAESAIVASGRRVSPENKALRWGRIRSVGWVVRRLTEKILICYFG